MSSADQSFRFRKSRRVLHEAPVRLVLPVEDGGGAAAGAHLALRTRDIAAGGMFVATPEPLTVGATARFLLHLGTAAAPDDVHGEATVIWTRATADGDDQPAGMGMRFSRVDPAGQERLARLLSEKQPESEASPTAPAPVAVAPAASVETAGGEPVGEESTTFAEARLVDADSMLPSTETEESNARSSGSREGDTPPVHSPPASSADPVFAAANQADSAWAGRGHEPARTDPVPGVPDQANQPRADMSATLTAEDDEWMKPESRSRVWPWIALTAAAVIAAALFAFREPLMRAVGANDAPPAESAPDDAPRFDISSAQTASDAAPDDAETPATADDPRLPSGDSAANADSTADAVPPTANSTTGASVAGEPRQVATGAGAGDSVATPTESIIPADPPTNATALRSIRAATRDGRTVIEIIGNAPFRRHHAMTLAAPPRLIVRLIGVQQVYDAKAVRAPRIRSIRTGVHGVGATRNLHVVIDLATPDIVTTVEQRGAAVVVSLSD